MTLIHCCSFQSLKEQVCHSLHFFFFVLIKEVTERSERITQLEQEKSALIKQLFEARARNAQDTSTMDSTFIWELLHSTQHQDTTMFQLRIIATLLWSKTFIRDWKSCWLLFTFTCSSDAPLAMTLSSMWPLHPETEPCTTKMWTLRGIPDQRVQRLFCWLPSHFPA